MGFWAAHRLVLIAFTTAAVLVSSRAIAGDLALGKHLSAECVTCHQATGQFHGIPPIVGWPDASFIKTMEEYRQKKRDNPIMQTIAGRFSNDELAALAAYFGSLKVWQGIR